jgi:hypothetical protein
MAAEMQAMEAAAPQAQEQKIFLQVEQAELG